MRVHSRIILLGVAWFLLGGLLAVGLHVRLTGVSNTTSEFTDQQMPVALAVESIRSQLLNAQSTCHKLSLDTDLNTTQTDCSKLRGQLWKIENDLVGLDNTLTEGELRAQYRPAFDSAVSWHKAARKFMIGRETELQQYASADPNATNVIALPPATAALVEVATQFDSAESQFNEFMDLGLRPSLTARALASREVVSAIRNESLMLIALASAAGCALTILMARAVHNQQRTAAAAQDRQAFDARVVDALGMASTEPDALRLVEDIISRVNPDLPAAILIADSSRAHLHQAAATEAARSCTPLCGVRAPSMCPAVRRGFEVTFHSSNDFDACPHLRHRASGPCSATCVPITITGQQVGVLHAVTPDTRPLNGESILRLTVIAAKAGERIGVIRAFDRSEDQATKDSLTGLLNRRSAEDRVQQLQRSQISFCIVYADIDHFKKLNDTHGHETGDRVLRQFSRVMREALRPTDIVSRWGGEEFVMLLPEATIEQARPVIERLRMAIAENSGGGSVPPVTASFGLAECGPKDDFAERLNEADSALLRAKQEGRNRIALAGATLARVG